MESLCTVCKKPLKENFETKFNCETHTDIYMVCGDCILVENDCPFCKERQQPSDQILKPSDEILFIFLVNTPLNTRNTFPLVIFKEKEISTEINLVQARPDMTDFLVYEYAGIAKINPREFLIVGGEVVDGTTNDVFTLTFESIGNVFQYSWQQLPNCLDKRYSHKVYVIDSQKYLSVGGMDSNRNFLKSSEIFENGKWNVGPELNHPRSQASGLAFKDFIYIFGGFSGSKVHEASIERISQHSLTKWEKVPINTNGFESMTACLSLGSPQGEILLIGGSNGKSASKTIFSWNIEKNEIFKKKEEIHNERANFIGKIIGKNEILVLGGEKNGLLKAEKIDLESSNVIDFPLEEEDSQSVYVLPGYFWVELD